MQDLSERLKIVEDNLVVMAHLEARQAKLIKEHSQILVEIERDLKSVTADLKSISTNAVATDARIDKLVSAIGALIARS